MKRTIPQNKRLYQLFGELGITGDIKADMVADFTNNRTEKSSEMTIAECNNLIRTLENNMRRQLRESDGQRQKMRRQIFRLMYDIGVINSEMDNEQKIGIINTWIYHRMGQLDKKLNLLDVIELTKFITILQTVRRRYAERANMKAHLN